MSDITDAAEGAVKGRIGKFPVWVIALALVGVIGGGYWLYSRRGGGAAATGAAAAPATTTDSGYVGDGLPGASGSSDGTDPGGMAGNPLVNTNQAWLARASASTALAFGASPTTVFGVLYNYVNGNDWLQSQQKYIDRALNDFGQPPEGTMGLGMAIADPKAPVTTPSKPTTPVVHKNPAPSHPTPKTPTKVPTAGAIGSSYNLSHSERGYVTATAANDAKGPAVTVPAGRYFIFNKVSRSHGTMLNLSKVKGVPGAWVNPN